MKWFIASDIHGSYKYTKMMIQAFQKEKADRMLLLGDYLNHGPRNGLPEEYDPIKTSELLNEYKNDILCIQGNCDSEVDEMCLDFPVDIKTILVPIEDRLIFVTHGHIYNTENLPQIHQGDVLLHGHTHIPALEEVKGIYYINPGSISIPKGNSCHSYMILENKTFIWKNLITGEKYKEFSLSGIL